MNCICSFFIIIAINSFFEKFTFSRNVLKKSTPHLTGPSSLYTIRSDQCIKNWLLVTSHDQEPWPRELSVSTLGHYTWIDVLWLLEKYHIIWVLQRVKVWIMHGVDHQGNKILANYWIQRFRDMNTRAALILAIVWRHM
jgi:hypothetical protein